MAQHDLNPQAFTIGGKPAWTFDALPAVGAPAPAFHLADAAFRDWELGDFAGKRKVLNVAPSLDTPVCQMAAKKFTEAVAAWQDTVLLNVTADLPFAQARFCAGLSCGENVRFLSSFRAPEFGMDYGVLIVEHPMMGLLARAQIVIDGTDTVRFAALTPELTQEPDYEAVLRALDGI
jgi:thiol peroxidase